MAISVSSGPPAGGQTGGLKFGDIKDALLSDLTETRAQIRGSEGWHVQISLVLTVSVVTGVVVATLNPDRLPLNSAFLFALINLVIIAQFSFLLNYHFFYIQLWTGYLSAVEAKLQLLYQGCNVVEFESRFAPLYFHQSKRLTSQLGRTDRHKGAITVLTGSPNRLLIGLIHLPSLAIYIYSTITIARDARPFWISILLSALFIILVLFPVALYLTMGRSPARQRLEEACRLSVDDFTIWLRDHGGLRAEAQGPGLEQHPDAS